MYVSLERRGSWAILFPISGIQEAEHERLRLYNHIHLTPD